MSFGRDLLGFPLNDAGYCSPSEGVKFADLPNGLAAISKANLIDLGEVTKPMAL